MEIDLQEKYSDDAKRLADSVNMHVFLGNTGKFAMYKLQDISTDNVAYDSVRDAVRMKWPNQSLYFWVCIPPSGMQLKEAESYISYNRKLYEAGMRMPDPDQVEYFPTIPNTKQDQRKQIRLLTK